MKKGKNIVTFSTKRQFAENQFTTQQIYCTVNNTSIGSKRFGTQLLFTQRWQKVLPANLTSFFPVQLLLLTGEARRGDTIAALIDWVNKYSVLVPVRCSLPCNTPSVCVLQPSKQHSDLMSASHSSAELMNDRSARSESAAWTAQGRTMCRSLYLSVNM